MSHVFGFTLMNDWSARDLQRKEMAVGLGPSKSKDFATSIGQYITTTDEIEGLIDNEGRLNIGVECYVNGRRYSSGNLIDMFWTFRKLIAWASKGTMLRKGDLIMSGTISTGCILELGAENYNWLKKGDTVSMRSSTLGELNNKVV
jgi:fumarylacetoacetate (FAA) hydrolase